MYRKFKQETGMGENIFLKEMKELQFEDYFKLRYSGVQDVKPENILQKIC